MPRSSVNQYHNHSSLLFSLMIRPPPRPTLFPYTPLFRSAPAPRLERRLGSPRRMAPRHRRPEADRKSTRLNSSHSQSSYAVFCLKKKKRQRKRNKKNKKKKKHESNHIQAPF